MVKNRFSKRLTYTLIALLIIIGFAVFIYALNPGESGDPGHNMEDFGAPSGCNPGQLLKWSENSWTCSNPGG